MSILNEVRQILYEENVLELIPTIGMNMDEPTGKTEIDNSYIKRYGEAVRDCSEHRSIDEAIDSVYKGLNAVDLIPYAREDEPWSGGFVNGSDLKPGMGGVAKLGLRKDKDMVINAFLKIDLYKNTSGDYEIASEIVMR